jgi:hypothetical protein
MASTSFTVLSQPCRMDRMDTDPPKGWGAVWGWPGFLVTLVVMIGSVLWVMDVESDNHQRRTTEAEATIGMVLQDGRRVRTGTLLQVTGCDGDGALVRPSIEVLAEPVPSRVVGEIAGTREGDPCGGSVVRVLYLHRDVERVMLGVQDLPEGATGWISEHEIGRILDAEACVALLRADAAACAGSAP